MRRYISSAGLVMMAGCLALLCASKPGGGLNVRRAQAEEMDHPQPMDIPGLRPIIIIDPGHGGNDEGATGYDLKEKDLALDVAMRLEGQLQKSGHTTVLTRRTDVYVPLPDRVNIANQYDHSLFVSIHFNQSRGTPASGVETYYAYQKLSPDFMWTGMNLLITPSTLQLSQGKDLAGAIQNSIAGSVPVINRGVKAATLFVISNVRNPAVLVEGGFVSNSFDAQQLKNLDYRDRLAAAIADGIINFETQQKPSVIKLAKAKN